MLFDDTIAARAVDSLYRAVLQDGAWAESMQLLREFLDASCVCLATRDERSGALQHFSSLDRGSGGEGAGAIACTVRPEKMFERSMSTMSVRSNLADSVPRSQRQVRLFAWHREEGRCPYCLGSALRIDAGHSAYLGAHWRHAEDIVGAAGDERLESLLPHVKRAFRLRAELGDLVARLEASNQVLSALPQGVVFVARNAVVMDMNRSAEVILTSDDGLTVESGMVQAASAEADAALRGLLAEAAAAPAPGGGPAHWSLSVPRPSGARPYEVLVTRPPRKAGTGAGDALVVLYLHDPEHAGALDEDAIEQYFGLNHEESVLVHRLASGLSRAQAGASLGMPTARVEALMRSVLRKTSAHHQGELLRLVLGSPAMLDGPPFE